MSSPSSDGINAEYAGYCFLDLDLDHYRQKLATGAAFVAATDLTYGLSSKDLLSLGGSEVSRLKDLIGNDHEWASKDLECGGIEIRPPVQGNRIVVRLYWDVAPLACQNFATLCANGGGSGGRDGKVKPAPIGESGKPLTYRGCNVHRCIPGFVLQGGDFVLGNGSGGESAFSNKRTFKDERAGLNLKHDRFGLLSMGNSGKNSNSSQFFFTLDKAPKCDGKHVIFGELVSGAEVLRAAEKLGTSDGTPSGPITITDCGVFHPLHTPGAGYWFDKPDMDSWTGVSPSFFVRPRIALLAPTDAAVQKFRIAIGSFACIAAIVCFESIENNLSQAAYLLMEALKNFSVDVVVIAPPCKDVKGQMRLPQSWIDTTDATVELDDVVVIAKPLEVLPAIQFKSWISKHRGCLWQFDGASSS